MNADLSGVVAFFNRGFSNTYYAYKQFMYLYIHIAPQNTVGM